GDDPVRAHLADPGIAAVPDKDVAGGVDRDIDRLAQPRLDGRTAVAGEARRAGPCHGEARAGLRGLLSPDGERLGGDRRERAGGGGSGDAQEPAAAHPGVLCVSHPWFLLIPQVYRSGCTRIVTSGKEKRPHAKKVFTEYAPGAQYDDRRITWK